MQNDEIFYSPTDEEVDAALLAAGLVNDGSPDMRLPRRDG